MYVCTCILLYNCIYYMYDAVNLCIPKDVHINGHPFCWCPSLFLKCWCWLTWSKAFKTGHCFFRFTAYHSGDKSTNIRHQCPWMDCSWLLESLVGAHLVQPPVWLCKTRVLFRATNVATLIFYTTSIHFKMPLHSKHPVVLNHQKSIQRKHQ